MARFARDCMQVLKKEVVGLETLLGPGTATLAMRIGLHSGSVTAGVLRGDRARFQVRELTELPISRLLKHHQAHMFFAFGLVSCLVTV